MKTLKHILLVIFLSNALALLPTGAEAVNAPVLKLPFTCGETFEISCGYDCGRHKDPEFYAVDFNIAGDGDCNQPVLSVAAGLATASANEHASYGWYVDVDHGDGYRSRYAHLVSKGYSGEVAQGKEIGKVGSTGFSTGCHLHFVLFKDGDSISPEPISGYTGLSEGKPYTSDNCGSGPDGWVNVADGVGVIPEAVAIGEVFYTDFKLKEYHGGSKNFEKLSLAILDEQGEFLYDAAMWHDVSFSPNQQKTFAVESYLYPSRPEGWYQAIVRGKLPDDDWFDFGVVPGKDATNPSVFYAYNTSEGNVGLSSAISFVPQDIKIPADFEIRFALKENDGRPVVYEKIAVAILDIEGQYLFDALNWENVAFAPHQERVFSGETYLYASRPAGLYQAVPRGMLPGGEWIDFQHLDITALAGQIFYAEPVEFVDSALEMAITEQRGDTEGDTELLDLDHQGVTGLEGIEYFSAVVQLSAFGNTIENLGPLSQLVRIQDMNIGNNLLISDLNPLGDLRQLTTLEMRNNKISALDPLKKVTSLAEIWADNNAISLLQPIRGLVNLSILTLDSNQISDLYPLADLPALRLLDLGYNQISDLSPLAELTALQWLDAGGNQISDLSPLAELTTLESLALYGNQISDLSPLATMTTLRSLFLSDSQISDISALANLTALTVLWLPEFEISDLSPLAKLTNMRNLLLWYNQLSDISVLSGFTSLYNLRLEGNKIKDVSPLVGLSDLQDLGLGNNQITDLSQLPRIVNGGDLRLEYNIGITDIDSLQEQSGITIDLRGNNNIPCNQLDSLLAREDLTVISPDDCAGTGSVCPAEAALTGSHKADIWLDTLRVVRDDVLMGSDIGRELVGTYYRHSREVSNRLLREPSLALQALGVLRFVGADLLALTSGNTLVIDASRAVAIRDFASRLKSGASPALSEALQRFIDSDLNALRENLSKRSEAAEPAGDGTLPSPTPAAQAFRHKVAGEEVLCVNRPPYSLCLE